jgi:YHS domain-containing protein
MSRDPVCGQDVDSLRARAVGIWGGRTYYFCSPEHKAEFARNPAAFGEQGAREPTVTQPVRARASARETRAADEPLATVAPFTADLTARPAPSRAASPAASIGDAQPLEPDAAPYVDGGDLVEDGRPKAPWKLMVVVALVAMVLVVVMFARR